MKPIWALVVILVAFGVVGRIDYEAAMPDFSEAIDVGVENANR